MIVYGDDNEVGCHDNYSTISQTPDHPNYKKDVLHDKDRLSYYVEHIVEHVGDLDFVLVVTVVR